MSEFYSPKEFKTLTIGESYEFHWWGVLNKKVYWKKSLGVLRLIQTRVVWSGPEGEVRLFGGDPSFSKKIVASTVKFEADDCVRCVCLGHFKIKKK